MKIVHRKRALHQKKLLRFTDNGAKIALVKRNSNRNLVLEGCRPCPLFGGKLDNAAIGHAQNWKFVNISQIVFPPRLSAHFINALRKNAGKWPFFRKIQ